MNKILINLMKFLKILFVTIKILIDLHILNKVCHRTFIYMKVYLHNTSGLKMDKSEPKDKNKKKE